MVTRSFLPHHRKRNGTEREHSSDHWGPGRECLRGILGISSYSGCGIPAIASMINIRRERERGPGLCRNVRGNFMIYNSGFYGVSAWVVTGGVWPPPLIGQGRSRDLKTGIWLGDMKTRQVSPGFMRRDTIRSNIWSQRNARFRSNSEIGTSDQPRAAMIDKIKVKAIWKRFCVFLIYCPHESK